MGRLFEIWIWILLPISVNGQVLFDDFGDRQRPVEFIRTELQKFNQGIERITKKLEGIENNVETKIRNMIESISKNIVKEEKTLIRNSSVQPTMKDETIRDILSAIQTEQQLLRQGMDATSNLTIRSNEKISGLMETTRDAMAILKGTETRPQKRDDLQTSLKAVTTTDESNDSISFCTNKMAVEFGTNLQMLQDGIENFTLIFENKLNILDEIRTTSQYLSDQLLSGDDIFLIKFNKSYEDMDSQFLLTLPNHNLNSTANRDVILVKRDTILGNDCADILQKYPNARGKNGVYNIFDTSNSSNTSKAKAVYCDMTTDNGGWTVIQKRVNGSVAFYRDWRAYKNGFGVAEHEYWIGNDMLHRLTSLRPQELRVDMQSFKSVKAYAVYSKFLVGDEASKYRLEVFGYYRGNAGDSLTKVSNNMSFSTPDQDNDGGSGNCAAKYKTAGWFNNCFLTNFNGLYVNYEKKYIASYLTWYEWNNWNSLKTFQMMIRPEV